MNTLSRLAGRFEKLLGKLPSPIRTPVEREWHPLKELFLERRPARLLLVGEDAEAYLRSLMPSDVRHDFSAPWAAAVHSRGSLRYVVARDRAATAYTYTVIAADAPDLFLLVGDPTPEALALLESLHQRTRERYRVGLPVIVASAAPAEWSQQLFASATVGGSIAAVVPINERETVLAAIAKALPGAARLDFARLTGERVVQHEIARTLTRASAAVCTAIGTQPIPLADLPILTALQGVMVAGIITASGREMNTRTVRDFLGAMGVNVGAAFLLREGARAAAKFFPGWGNAISGAVAGAGTYGVGMAAAAYFIDRLPLDEVRARLKLSRKRKKELK